MSLLGKKWKITNPDRENAVLDKLQSNRKHINFSQEDFHDPFLFEDMEKTIDRIDRAIKDQERIIVFGDYDVDGITSAAILVHTLKALNATVSYRLPHRVKDGYGLTEKFIPEFVEKDIKLVITVDCGISCHSVIEKAHEQGIDIIVTDHHTIPATPPEHAVSILHPQKSQYPYKELTGAGVALKLAQGLIQRFFPPEKQDQAIQELIDLAAMGTIADLGPLTGENRTIVKRGLAALSQTKWIGLKKLMQTSQVTTPVSTSCVGFRLGPRINAAGRIGDPYIALSLLLQEEHSPKLDLLSQKLEQLNNKRRAMTEEAFDQAKASFAYQKDLPYILLAHHADWHAGILGLVASKLVQQYARPSLIMQDFGDKLVGSARSPEYFNVIEAITHCGEHLTNFGGHAEAAGFTLAKKKLPYFQDAITKYAAKKLAKTPLMPTLDIDCYLQPAQISKDLIHSFEDLKPFGVANQAPLFAIEGIEPLSVQQIGSQGKHLKFTIDTPHERTEVIAFGMGHHADEIRRHRKIDIAGHLEINRWQNRETVQIRALDFRFKSQ